MDCITAIYYIIITKIFIVDRFILIVIILVNNFIQEGVIN